MNKITIHEGQINAFEVIERLIEQRCDQILKIAGKGNFDHPLMSGMTELISLQNKVEGLRGITIEKLKIMTNKETSCLS